MAQITYTNKVALYENPDVADINKCKAADMNEIKTVVNANQEDVGDIADLETEDMSSVVNAINEVNACRVYSTTENVVGRWINNKPVYRKVYTYSNISGGSAQSLSNSSGLTNITMVKIDSYVTKSTNSVFDRAYYSAANDYFRAFYNGVSNTIEIRCYVDSTSSATIILEYTKTTD